jgi:maltose-binding protein MalE
MKIYARILALICAILMLIPCFAACANTQGSEETTANNAQTQATPDDTTPAEDPRYDKEGFWKDDLSDEIDFKGETVTILYWDDVERPEFEITEEEADGDMVKDAIYRRNLATEERMGVTFEWVGTPGDSGDRANFTNYVRNAYSGGTFYDIIATYSRTAGMLLTNGFIQDLNEIEDSYINTEKPWWPENLVQTVTIGDSMYFISGDISTNTLYFMYGIFCNTNMQKNLNLFHFPKIKDLCYHPVVVHHFYHKDIRHQ